MVLASSLAASAIENRAEFDTAKVDAGLDETLFKQSSKPKDKPILLAQSLAKTYDSSKNSSKEETEYKSDVKDFNTLKEFDDVVMDASCPPEDSSNDNLSLENNPQFNKAKMLFKAKEYEKPPKN